MKIHVMAHFGTTIRTIREDRRLSQEELAAKAGISKGTIQNIERKIATSKNVRGDTFRKLATGLAMTVAELEQEIGEEMAPDLLDRNIETYSEQSTPEIPTFDLNISAGPWSDTGIDGNLADEGNLDDRRDLRKALERGIFRIRLRGDSMEKDWPDGSLVEFRCLRPDCGFQEGDHLELGQDYYVQRPDGATFKRLVKIHDDELVFQAVNRKKYPDLITVRIEDIRRMAKAEYLLLRRKGT